MEKYRRPDQYYIDRYDRYTIELLKELEATESNERENSNTPELWIETITKQSISSSSFRHTAIARVRDREGSIRKSIDIDEFQDKLVAKHPLPTGVTCNTCRSVMRFVSHFFDICSIPLLFVFECPQGHSPRRVIHPSGSEHFFPRRTCKKCRYEVIEKTRREEDVLFITTTCTMCGSVEEDKFPLKVKVTPELPITEEDRHKYCLSFKNDRTFIEDLKVLAGLFYSLDEQQKEQQLKQLYEVDKIVLLTIPALEKRLQKTIEDASFIKFTFDRPEMKAHTIIPFNCQDPTDRDEKASTKVAMQAIKESLRLTNWRLTGQIDYRLGYLTGKLKAYERYDDLIRLAKEIKG